MLHTSSIFSSDIQRRQTLLYIFLKSITIQHLRTSKASGVPASHHIDIAECKILKMWFWSCLKRHTAGTKFCENLSTDSKAEVGHVCTRTLHRTLKSYFFALPRKERKLVRPITICPFHLVQSPAET